MIIMFSQACPMFASEFDKALAAGVSTIIIIIVSIIISTIIIIITISIEIVIHKVNATFTTRSRCCCRSAMGRPWQFFLHKTVANSWKSKIE